jgi:hypothetical protein
MLTFLDFISTIQGCSSIRQGVALRGHSFSRLCKVSRAVLSNEEGTYQHSMKYLKFSDHLMPASGSSFSVGIGCRTM